MSTTCRCGARDSFVQDFSFGLDYTCTECGTIDEARSSAANYLDTYDGRTLGNGENYGAHRSSSEQERAARERKFENDFLIKAVDWLFNQPNILGLAPGKNPLGLHDREHPFVKLVWRIYRDIRAKDVYEEKGKGKKQVCKETVNAETRKGNYHLAVAIRFAAMQNNLLLAYKVLGKEGEETFPAAYKGERGVLEAVLPLPFLRDMLNNMQPSHPDGDNPISESRYLHRVHRQFLRLLKRPSDPLYTVICNCYLVVERLKALVNAPDKAALRALTTFGKKSSSAYRKWSVSDFDYFREEAIAQKGGWDNVLRMAYNLYRATQTVMLWNNSTSYVYAVALVLTAAYGAVKTLYPYPIELMAELCAQYGTTHSTTINANNALRRLIIAWSSSLQDAGLETPYLNLPTRGLVGEGTSGWNGDARRHVPPAEIWIVSIEIVANNWRRIMQTRLKTRTDVIPYAREQKMVQTAFAQNTPDIRIRPRARTGFSAKALELKKQAEATEVARRSRRGTTSESDRWSLDEDSEEEYINGDGLTPPFPHWIPSTNPQPSSSAPALPAEVEERYRLLERTAAEELDDLLLQRDSSDEEEGFSSDDEGASSLFLKGMMVGRKRKRVAERYSFSGRAAVLSLEEEIANTYNYDDERLSPKTVASSFRGESEDLSDVSASPDLRPIRRLPGSRFDSPTPSTLYSLGSAVPGSVAMSRRSSMDTTDDEDEFRIPNSFIKKVNHTPQPSRPVAEIDPAKSHIGMLVREREEYLTYILSIERVTGRLVSLEIETYLLEWLANLRAQGAMPARITTHYLASIGLRGKHPKTDNISDWILTQEWRWSPLECVLRAGIEPRELPVWMVPHSRIGVIRLLEHYNNPFRRYERIPEYPAIPDRFKADPQRFRKEIQAIRTAWEAEDRKGFPVFFPTHEMMVLDAEADALFFEGEMYGEYLRSEEDLEECRRDREFMYLIGGLDPSGEPWYQETEEKRKKRQKRAADNEDFVTPQFMGLVRAINKDGDGEADWTEAGLSDILRAQRGGDEEDGQFGDDEYHQDAAIAAAREAFGEDILVPTPPKAKRKDPIAAGTEAKKGKKDNSEMSVSPSGQASRAGSEASTQTERPSPAPVTVRPSPAPAPTTLWEAQHVSPMPPSVLPSRAGSEVSTQTLRPSPAPASVLPSHTPATFRASPAPAAVSRGPSPAVIRPSPIPAAVRASPAPAPTTLMEAQRAAAPMAPAASRLPVGMAGLLNPMPAPEAASSNAKAVATMKRVRDAEVETESATPTSDLPPPTKKPKAATPVIDDSGITQTQARAEELQARKVLATRREVLMVHAEYWQSQMRIIRDKSGLPVNAKGNIDSRLLEPSVREIFHEHKAKRDKAMAELDAIKKETTGMIADKPQARAELVEWAAKNKIPLRILRGWGKVGSVWL